MSPNPSPSARTLPEREFFYGHKACAGCGGSIAVRLALKVLGERTFTAVPAGCMAAVGFVYPQLAFDSNAIISTFPGTASMLSGIAAGARALGLKEVHTVGFAGDGGTAESRRVAVKAFGETVWGVPYYVFVPLLRALLFAPLVYVMSQLMVLMALRLRTSAGIYHAQEARRALIVVVLGGIYFVVLAGLWVAYTSALGI